MADTLKLDQYDDDLTIGLDDFDDDIYVDEDDLLRFQPPESPLAKLQSIVISIDWEISDEILLQFNEEILSLRELWVDEKIYLVYLQALEQISKYIYQEKATAHPSAVTLLPLFFQNLEKISSSDTMDEDEKQAILVEDVQRFNHLKKEIGGQKAAKDSDGERDGATSLQSLKALVLGLDWEVTESDLGELRREVMYLENLYSASKPRLILLQGIGTITAYIQHKGGNADASAFSLLHDFFATLERLATSSLSANEEKEALFVEVEKFNVFKAKIAGTLSPEAIERDEKERSEEMESTPTSGVVVPAFSDVDPAQSIGFQEEMVAEELGNSEELADRISTFFPEEDVPHEDPPIEDVAVEAESRLDDFFGDEMTADVTGSERELALQGVAVEVEGDDDSDDEEPLLSAEESPASIAQSVETAEEPVLDVEGETESRLDDLFGSFEESPLESATEDFALKGVDVETEADDDSDEEDLARVGNQLAPALATGDEVLLEEDIESSLDSFFGDDTEDVPQAPAAVSDIEVGLENSIAESSVEGNIADELGLFFDEDDETVGDDLPESAGVPASQDELLNEDDIEATLDSFFDDFGDDVEHPSVASTAAEAVEDGDSIAPALSFVEEEEEGVIISGKGADVVESEEESLLVAGLEDTLDAFFTGKDDIEFSDAPEDDFLVDEFFGVTEDELDSDSANTEAESTVDVIPAALGVAAIGGITAMVTSDSEDKDDDVSSSIEDFFGSEDSEDDLFASSSEDTIATVFEEVAEDTPEDYVAPESLLGPVVAKQEIPDALVPTTDLENEPVVESLGDVATDEDLFADIRGSISSLSFDISDSVIDGVIADINALRQKFSADPLTKSFLQLMSTLSQHIKRYQYEASSEAFTLLIGVQENMEETIGAEPLVRQNTLLTDTCKVLQWQQELIESKDSPMVEPQQEAGSQVIEDEPLSNAHEGEVVRSEHDVDMLRGELQELRVTLQDELACLRRDLMKK